MAETISARIPEWLVERASPFEKSSTSHDIQVGAQIAQQWQQNQRLQRAQQMQDEVKRLALEEKERIAEGTVEVTRVLAEMGQSGDYTSPVLQSKFWTAVSKNPKFAGSPAFKDIMDTFQYAEQAKERKLLLEKRYDSMANIEQMKQEGRIDVEKARQLGQADLFEQKLAGLMKMEGVKQEGRVVIQNMRGDIAAYRDVLRGDIASDLEDQRQTGRVELRKSQNEAAFQRLRETLDHNLLMLDAKSEAALELRQYGHELDVIRDSKRPTTLRPERFDLDESDRMLLNAKLKGLQTWRESNMGKRHDAAYDAKLDAIEKEFAGRKKIRSTPAPTAAPAPAAASTAAPAPPPSERQAGTIYQTPKGPYRWNGSGWEAP